MNIVTLSGRLCSDVEFKTTPSGANVSTFRLAVQREYKNSDGKYEADFFNVQAWRGSADFVRQYFGKGKPIEISGRLQSRSYTDKQGEKRYVVEVIADKVGFVPETKSRDIPVETPQQLDSGFAEPAPDDTYPF